jgi:hypothetical protein
MYPKFRVWDLVEEEMMYENAMDNYIINTGEDGYFHLLRVARFFPMQYVGLKDKYDMEIYEGDIVQGKHRNYDWTIPQKVTFLKGCFMFGNWNAHEYFNNHTDITVLGNGYEDPELLEEMDDKK